MNEYWEKITEGFDEKYIDEAVDLHIKKTGQETVLVPLSAEVPPPRKKSSIFIGTILKISAVLAVVVGIGAVLKINGISVSELWASRPSQTMSSASTLITEASEDYIYNTSVSEKTTVPVVTASEITDDIPVTVITTEIPEATDSEVTTIEADAELPVSGTTEIVKDEKIMLKAPDSGYLAEYDLEENPPHILFARDTYFLFLMEGGKVCNYDANYDQLSGLYDIYGALSEKGANPDSIGITVYTDPKKIPIFVVSGELMDGTGFSYTLEMRYYEWWLEPIKDESYIDTLTPYDGVVYSGEKSCDGFIAVFEDGYTYLTDNGNEKMRGAYRLEAVHCTKNSGESIIIPFYDPEYDYTPVIEEPEEQLTGFALLGDYEITENGRLCCVDDSGWEVCNDYCLLRDYFFGVWGEGENKLIIDDSEEAYFAKSMSVFYDNFYKVSDKVFAILCGGSGGAVLYFMDINNPDVLYGAYGSPGNPPNGFACNDEGEPIVFELKRSEEEINEPKNDYLSVFRLKEIYEEYGIDFDMLVDFGFQTENGTQYHDSRYYFYPMYLVSKTDYRIEIRTKTGNGDTVYGEGVSAEVMVIFDKVNEKWIRTIDSM